MDIVESVLPGLLRWLPAVLTLAIGALGLVLVDQGLGRPGFKQERWERRLARLDRQIERLALALAEEPADD